MPIVEEAIVISRPAMEVFEFVTEPENVLLYSSNVAEYEQVSGGPRDVGGVARGTVRVAGRRLNFTTELVEVEPGRMAKVGRLTQAFRSGLSCASTRWPSGLGLPGIKRPKSFGGFYGKIGDAVVVKVYARDVKSNLANAKTLLEA